MKRLSRVLPTAVLALISYGPLLLSAPGRVGADTKTYLYLDPGRLLSQAWSMWDPSIGLGTVTHQNLGYLFPMGPYYWLMETAGVPDWIAQRLWLGSIIFAAGTGVRYLLGQLGWRGSGRTVAALAYMLSPYLLAYAARISVILLPWAALPWMIAMTVRALRHGGWRDPARFALIVLVVGGVNATALLMIGLGPVLWLLYQRFTDSEQTWGRVGATTLRIGLLTGLTSLWWVAGLWAQGQFGIPIVRYTETYKTVADASYAQEALRGLGYWFFYGRDKLGPWIEAGEAYTSHMWLLVISFTIPILALAGAALVRWGHRGYFLVLLAVGGLIGVGAHPWDAPSPAGAAFQDFTNSDAGLALRSTPRALPLLVLSMAIFLGMGAGALSELTVRRLPSVPRLADTPLGRPAVARIAPSLLLGTLVIVNLPTLWLGRTVATNLDRDEDIPTYWIEATRALDGDPTTRVLELPGADFASYRWGNTVDPVTPGLMDRPYVARELIPYGSPASADLLNALDRPMQEGTHDPDALVPIAQLMGVGDIVLRSDLEYERYRTPRPVPTWEWMNQVPGLDEPIGFGDPVPNVAGPEQPMIDDMELGMPRDLEDPPPVGVFPVSDPVGVVRAESGPPLVIAGDATGLVDVAGVGLVEPGRPVRFAASLDPEEPLPEGATLVITDTNRRSPYRWGTIRENRGHTEQAGEVPLVDDPGDNRLEIFPEATDDNRTVAIHAGGAAVQATNYGNPVTYTAGDRPVNALDGDPDTSWRVGAFSDVTAERLVIDLDRPAGTREVTLLQPQNGVQTRYITDLRVIHEDGSSQEVRLDESSRGVPGQTIELDQPVAGHLELEILDTDVGRMVEYDGQSAVGFSEVGIGDLVLEEQIRPPVDLLEQAGEGVTGHDLTFAFTRQWGDPAEPVRSEPEEQLIRTVDLPSAGRTFDITGTVRASGFTSEAAIAALLGLDDELVARASASLPGDLTSMAWAAFDEDPGTAWQTPFLDGAGRWIDLGLPEPQTIDEIELDIIADGRHSVPTEITVTVDDGPGQPVPLPDIVDQTEEWAIAPVVVSLPEPVTGSRVRIELSQVRQVSTPDWYGTGPIVTPIGIERIDIGQPGVISPDRAAPFDTSCRDGLLSIDDEPVRTRVVGTVGDVLDRAPLELTACQPVALSSGSHVLRSVAGRDAGLNVDQVLLVSERPTTAAETPADVAAAPIVTVADQGQTSFDLDVSGIDGPFWLVLGQSHNSGWTARAAGLGDLGPPELIDGFANGWWIDPGGATELSIDLRWWPQRVVNAMLLVSALAVLACLWIAFRPLRSSGSADGGSGVPSLPALRFTPVRFGRLSDAHPVDRRWRRGLAVRSTATLLLTGVLLLGWIWVASPPTWHRVVSLGLLVLAVPGGRWRWLAGAATAGIYAVVGVSIVVEQYLGDHRADFDWPSAFEYAHAWGIVVIVVSGGLGALDIWASARSARRSRDGEQDQGGVVDVVDEREV